MVLLSANSSSCGVSGVSSMPSVGRLLGMKTFIMNLKKGCPKSIRCGKTVWKVVVCPKCVSWAKML